MPMPGKGPACPSGFRSLAGSWQVVEILRADGHLVRDVRPMVRLSISVVAGNDDRQESGSYGMGGREGFERFITTENWQGGVDEALRQALVNLDAVPAPAGRWTWCLGQAGPASCCTKPSATAWRATSTARRPPPLPG
jgi:TldD protein